MKIKQMNQIIISLLLSFVTINSFSQTINCRLEGTINGRDTKEIILIQANEDPRHTGTSISVIDNRFEFTLETQHLEEYCLVYKEELDRGGFRPIRFFPDSSVIKFTLFSSRDYNKNIIAGGILNKTKQSYEREQKAIMMDWLKPIRAQKDSLRKIGRYESNAMQDVKRKLREVKSNDERSELYESINKLRDSEAGYTTEGWLNKNQSDSINRKMTLRQIDYVAKNKNIYSYSLLLDIIDKYKKYLYESDNKTIESIVSSYEELYPTHPYTIKSKEILLAQKTLQVGGRYIDFSAQNLDGEIKQLSDEINGKVALINLWSVWCGPCRATGKSMVPVYEKYKDKGFTVIGVASIQKDTKQLKVALEKDKYPWLNLIELDNKNGIWSKYNISNSGGSMWLVDSDGKILAVHPSAEEVDKILGGLLK